MKYFVNITSGADEIIENVKRAEDAGADGLMINFAVVGYSVLKHVAEHTALPVLGHSAGTGMYFEGAMNGMASPLAVGKLARLGGADIVMINTPYGGYPLLHQKYMQTVAQLTLPFYDIKPLCHPLEEASIQGWWRNISVKWEKTLFLRQEGLSRGIRAVLWQEPGQCARPSTL